MVKQLPPDTVVKVRERHEELRQIRDSEPPEDRLTDGQLDEHVAKEFGLSRTYVSRLVEGSARPECVGPIDHRRIHVARLFHEEAESISLAEARRRRSMRLKGIDPEPKALRYAQKLTVVDERGRDTDLAYVLEPGHSIRVEMVTEGGTR